MNNDETDKIKNQDVIQGSNLDSNYREIQPGMVNPITLINKDDDAETKQYLVLYYATDEDDNDVKSFEICTGRTETFNFIKNMIESINIHDSLVLSENNTLKNIISVYEFMKYLRDNDLIYDKTFDIEEYNIGDIEE
jgi:hypothetical protein